MEKTLGNIETKIFEAGELVLESGKKLENVVVAYETYGWLNAEKSNAILITHAFSGDAHAANGAENPGWWSGMIGPGKAFDTDKYFVICSNVLGGCAGTTGPSSINPATGKCYGSDFPAITIGDIVTAQKRLVDFFGIDKLFAVVGGSMGGMQVLQWLKSFPRKVRAAIPISGALKHSPQQIAFNHVQRQAIKSDLNWQCGNYYNTGRNPSNGLSTARMLGHITYTSEEALRQKFGRHRELNGDFAVESYLNYNGDKFTKRFDANSYLCLTEAMDNFDLTKSFAVAESDAARIMIISFESDWLYPTWQSVEIAAELESADYQVEHVEIESTRGHDAFLLEFAAQTAIIRNFLRKVHPEKVPRERSLSLVN